MPVDDAGAILAASEPTSVMATHAMPATHSGATRGGGPRHAASGPVVDANTPNPIPTTMSNPEPTMNERRKRGRPALMTREQLVASIRDLASRPDGLFRVHLTDSDLYARARRMFGSWSAAVSAAGVDYGHVVDSARRRSLETRRARA